LRALGRGEPVRGFEAMQVVDADEGGDGLPVAFGDEALPGIAHPRQEIPGALAQQRGWNAGRSHVRTSSIVIIMLTIVQHDS
jgi:hypothetical protein